MSAPGLKITNFHYTHTSFPPQTEYVEWPKWVHMEGFKSVIAQNAEEEAALRARQPGDVVKAVDPQPVIIEAPARTLSGPNDEREILFQIAAEKNIKVDKRWKTDRIRTTIERETS